MDGDLPSHPISAGDSSTAGLTLTPGIYVAFYESEATSIARLISPTMPFAVLTVGPQVEASAGILFCDVGARDAVVLSEVNNFALFRVVGAAVDLYITEHHTGHSGAVSIKRIDFATESFKTIHGAAAEPHDSASTGDLPLDTIVHLSDVGDVRASNGGWIGGTLDRHPIEGFMVNWRRPVAGLQLRYRCSSRSYAWTPWMTAGEFCGTRHQNAPIEGISFALVGPAADQYEVNFKARFRGFGVSQICHDGADCETPNRDPLLAFYVGVRKRGSEQPGRGELFVDLRADEFDEAAYMRTYPDVAAGIARGEWVSGYYHYVMFGRAEGRSGFSLVPTNAFADEMDAASAAELRDEIVRLNQRLAEAERRTGGVRGRQADSGSLRRELAAARQVAKATIAALRICDGSKDL